MQLCCSSTTRSEPLTGCTQPLALDRIRQAGGSFVSTVQIMSEMVANWAEDAGPTILPILSELYAALE